MFVSSRIRGEVEADVEDEVEKEMMEGRVKGVGDGKNEEMEKNEKDKDSPQENCVPRA